MASCFVRVPRAAVLFWLRVAPRAASVWPSKSASGEVDQTFARRYRLTKTDEFSSVFGFRRAIRGQWLMLHYQPRSDGSARLGLVVGLAAKPVRPLDGKALAGDLLVLFDKLKRPAKPRPVAA